MTGRHPTTGQRLVDAVTGDQSPHGPLDTDIDVSVTSQPCFSGREACANALAIRAQETSRDCVDGEHYRECEKAKRSTGPSFRQAPEQVSAQRCLGDWRGRHFGRSRAPSIFLHIQRRKEVRPARRALFSLAPRETVEPVQDDLSARHVRLFFFFFSSLG